MEIHNSCTIHGINKNIKPLQKSNDILIPTKEYCLNQNFFDPSESSSPNEFMLKLYLRMYKYQKKEESLFNE
jgi:hypothetical protein